MFQMWQMWSGHLTDQDVQSIIDESETYPSQDAYVGSEKNSKVDIANSDIRRSTISWVNSSRIGSMVWDYAVQANRRAFGFDISCVGDIQYTKYSSDNIGKYNWHHDTFWADPTPYQRKLSMVIQLSDPSEYEGGEFEYDPQYILPDKDDLKKKGTVFVFPSYIPHRVTEVTKGERKSLVSWIEGPRFR
jgi:PKHD-type hydroxylase